jgi:subtilase family serine protease
VEIFCTDTSCFGGSTGEIFFTSVGGTSLACPMFSAMWALANQKAGHPLGQAARTIYNLSDDAITDIVPVSSPFNVSGLITTSTGLIGESANQLAAPLGTRAPFFSALYNSPFSGAWFVLTFGTDSSLQTARGWDNVTGLGTPNGMDFINAVAPGRH